jgi:spore photoproduct lyase
VDDILNLPHNGHTVIAWSINNDLVSRKFEIGAPSFDRRLEAAWKVQQAGYQLRLRLDPVVPLKGWEKAYADTVKKIFQKVTPERITLGTLRFEERFYHLRDSIFATGPELPEILSDMRRMFGPKRFEDKQRPKIGKYSFSGPLRIEIFDFIIKEIRKYSNCHIALCKESAAVWNQLGLDLSRVRCVCQLDYVDMSKREDGPILLFD